MAVKVSKDQCRLTVIEFEVRDIDEYGDAGEVEFFETEKAARLAAMELIDSGAIAVVVEKHTSRRPSFLFAEPDKYVTVATYGNNDALTAGGWND